MPTKKMKKKAPKKAKKAVQRKPKNGHVVNVGNLEPEATAYLGAVAAEFQRTFAPQPPSYRSLKDELGGEIAQFRDYLLEKYTDYHGHDMRRDVAWFMEQYGNGILSDIERAKRVEREKIIAENRAREEAAAAAEQK